MGLILTVYLSQHILESVLQERGHTSPCNFLVVSVSPLYLAPANGSWTAGSPFFGTLKWGLAPGGHV
jgi:hypothetical protein